MTDPPWSIDLRHPPHCGNTDAKHSSNSIRKPVNPKQITELKSEHTKQKLYQRIGMNAQTNQNQTKKGNIYIYICMCVCISISQRNKNTKKT